MIGAGLGANALCRPCCSSGVELKKHWKHGKDCMAQTACHKLRIFRAFTRTHFTYAVVISQRNLYHNSRMMVSFSSASWIVDDVAFRVTSRHCSDMFQHLCRGLCWRICRAHRSSHGAFLTKVEQHDWHYDYDRYPAEVNTWMDRCYDRSHKL